MGSVLSKMEEQEMTSQLQGIEPASLAGIIWDTISSVGVDDESEKFGISFEGGKESPKIIFWDNGEVTEMPKKVFLEILEMISERVIKTYETEYNIEESQELKPGVDNLKLAKARLQEEIESLQGQEGAKEYRGRLDSIQSVEEESKAEEMVQEVRQRRGSLTWRSEDNLFDGRQRRLSSKGLEGVVDRLPELRRRYEDAIKPMQRVRKKIMALGIFGSKINPENRIEDEEMLISTPPEVYPRHTNLDSLHESHNSLPEQDEPTSSTVETTTGHTILDLSSRRNSLLPLLESEEEEPICSTIETTTLRKGHTILDLSSRRDSLSPLLESEEEEPICSTIETTTLRKGHTILDLSKRHDSLLSLPEQEEPISPSEITFRRDSTK